jgi:hypothetical protein
VMSMDGISGRRAIRVGYSLGAIILVEVDRGRTYPTIGRWSDASESIDQQREPRPSDAVLLAVLEPGDDRLVDARICLEHPLAPPQRPPATLDLDPDELETALLLRISRLTEPSHATRLAAAAYLAAIPRWTAHHPRRDMPSMGINNRGGRGRLKSSINIAGFESGPTNAFRGSVELMMQTNRAGA